MQRLGELNNKVIVEQKTAPENKYVIWKDPVENKFKEFKESGWVESDQISPAGGGSGFPYPYQIINNICIELTDSTPSEPTKISTFNPESDYVFGLLSKYNNMTYCEAINSASDTGNKYIQIHLASSGQSSLSVFLFFSEAKIFGSYTGAKGDIVLFLSEMGGVIIPRKEYNTGDIVCFINK